MPDPDKTPGPTTCPALLSARPDAPPRQCGRRFRRTEADIAAGERRCGACRRNGWPVGEARSGDEAAVESGVAA